MARLLTTTARPFAAILALLMAMLAFTTGLSAQADTPDGRVVLSAGAQTLTVPALPPGEPPKKARREARRLNAKALGAHRKGDWDTAISGYVAALDADPAHILARYNLACALARKGSADDALRVLAVFGREDCSRCRRQLDHATRDTDFASMRADPRFVALTKPAAKAAVAETPTSTPAPVATTKEKKQPAWGVTKGIGGPVPLVGPGRKVAPMIRFRRWKRALPDFCTRRDMQVMETDIADGARWVFAWSFEGTGDDPDCPHPTAGLVASPRGALETTAYCVDGIEVMDIDGDGHKDLLINHVGCNGPMEGQELEICLDRPVQPWCKTVAVDLVSYEIVTRGKAEILQFSVTDDLERYDEEDDESLLTWRQISWDGTQLTETAYKTEPGTEAEPIE